MDTDRVERTLGRIAYQLMEQCHESDRVALIGIEPRGPWVANNLARLLENLGGPVPVCLSFNADSLKFSTSTENLPKVMVVVDDILNTGRTMMAAISAAAALNPERLLTACLVDRQHRLFPVQCDFTGMSLATTMHEHLSLVIEPAPAILLQ